MDRIWWNLYWPLLGVGRDTTVQKCFCQLAASVHVKDRCIFKSFACAGADLKAEGEGEGVVFGNSILEPPSLNPSSALAL